MTPREVILGAADYLETHGICRDGRLQDGMRKCVVKALSDAAGDDELYHATRFHLIQRLNNDLWLRHILSMDDAGVISTLRAAA